MTSDSPGAAPTRVAGEAPGVDRWLAAVRSSGDDATRLAAILALATVLPLTVARVALNVPVALPGPSLAGSVGALAAVATVGPALAAAVVALTRAERPVRVGLLSTGVFGLLAVVDGAATLPAAGAIATAGVLVVRPWRAHPSTGPRRLASATVGWALAAGVAGTLLGATGTLPTELRTLGGVAAVAGLAGLPLVVRPAEPRAWLAGGAVGATVVAAGVVAPFVTGATLLVVAGAVGLPVVLLAVGAAGTATVAADAAIHGRFVPAAGGVLLLAVGVPGSIQRAVPFVLGLSLVLASVGGSGVADRG